MSRSKDIGTRGETAVVKAARAYGFGNAERRALAGSADLGDVLLCPGVVVEVKAGQQTANPSDAQVAAWMAEAETERQNANANLALLVLKRHGKGDAAWWWCYLPLGDLVSLAGSGTAYGIEGTPVRLLFVDALRVLRADGWGDPLTPDDLAGGEQL